MLMTFFGFVLLLVILLISCLIDPSIFEDSIFIKLEFDLISIVSKL